jgi:phosphinothricin acetyltransferase
MPVRDATEADLDRITEIYNQTIVDSHVSFDATPYDRDRRVRWWEERDPELDCLVAEIEGRVVGVAYSSWYRPKDAYRSSVETTIVLDAAATGQGLGTQLLGALVQRLITRGLHRAIAVIALPNDASVALHRRLGYREVGTLTEVGFKLGRYWDTVIFERDLAPAQS